MDISSARLTALLKEAMTPQAVLSAKADPSKAALVKALVQPPAVAPAQPAAPALTALLPATEARTQQTGTAEILQAYLALAEPGGETVGDAGPTMAPARKPTSPGEERGPGVPLARTVDGGAARPPAMPWLALLAPEVSPPRRSPVTDGTTKRGQIAFRSNDAARPANGQIGVGLMSLAAGFLAAAIVSFVVFMLR
jgi:hypothetical protein